MVQLAWLWLLVVYSESLRYEFRITEGGADICKTNFCFVVDADEARRMQDLTRLEFIRNGSNLSLPRLKISNGRIMGISQLQ